MHRCPAPGRAPYADEVSVSRAVRTVVVGVLLAVSCGAGASAASHALSEDPALSEHLARPDGAALPDDAAGPVVVLGTSGVRWADLDPASTPALWELATGGATGSLVTRSVRTVSCPADGWLALGAGNRAGDALPEAGCRELAEPSDGGAVPRWEVYVAERDAHAYGSRLGLLGEVVREHGLETLAVGPGAAIALAGQDGVVVGEHEPVPSEPAALTAALTGTSADLVVVDLGAVLDGADRAEQLARVEERAAAAAPALAGARTSILVSLADDGARPHLGVLAARGLAGVAEDAVLRTGSTRQDGYVLATDLTPTVLRALDLEGTAPPGTLVGSPATGASPAGDRVARMVDLDRHATSIRALTPTFFTILIVVNLALYAVVWLRPHAPLRLAGTVVGALPVATFLANLLPWWRAGGTGLYLAVASFVAVLAGLALLGPWRRHPLGPLTVVAGVTAVTILADVLTGSRLQLGSPMGVHPLVAGRFYGLNNSAFALLMVSSLAVAAVAGHALAARGRRAAAVGLVAVTGAVVTVVDGMPGLGSDFGGPPALVPAFTVLALRVAGVRVSWRRLLVVLGAGVLVVSAFAVVDWTRPEADRTHLGRFVQTVLDGGLGDVVWRKLGQNLTILTSSWLVLLVGAGIALVVWLVGRPDRSGANRAGRGLLAAASADLPALRLALPAAATGLAIGFAVNDSGVVIPAIGMSLAVPLLVATLAAWRGARERVSAP